MPSITKVLLAMEERVIAPNLHFNTPNPNIVGLQDGRMAVVTEPTPWDGGFASINSFGMGGSNAHSVFRDINVLTGPMTWQPESPTQPLVSHASLSTRLARSTA
ncbi:fatty acid synthase [Elysia marginata]|uniref:Fatty acid synthase n=1 Tax=Elysia marginata TaxID=1093978 RepID=A0AAV4FJ30_9GAST|nr:fatty acid synthase [Elysia marginata]